MSAETVDIIVIGASLGGLVAVPALVAALPEQLAAAVVIVQHRAPDTESILADILTARCGRPVIEPCHGDPIDARAYLAPAGYHLLIDDGTFALSTDAPVNFARPSIDVTMESAADSYGSRAAAVVLTGASVDGARGARAIARAGGRVLIQAPSEALSPVAPAAAAASVTSARARSLGLIGEALADLCGAAP